MKRSVAIEGVDSTSVARALDTVDWAAVAASLDEEGHAVLRSVLAESAGDRIAGYYDDPDVAFRSTIDLERFGFGRGQYRYFADPLPKEIAALRRNAYPPLAEIANEWAARLGEDVVWPERHEELQARCRAAGQTRPTPLLLRYGEGDYNCLHQDLYGEIQFPLQIVFLLSRPGVDFDGGELVLVEQRPRMQSRPIVVDLDRGDAVVIPVRHRPRQGARSLHRAPMRHGVSRLRRGRRTTLGLIFHDAR